MFPLHAGGQHGMQLPTAPESFTQPVPHKVQFTTPASSSALFAAVSVSSTSALFAPALRSFRSILRHVGSLPLPDSPPSSSTPSDSQGPASPMEPETDPSGTNRRPKIQWEVWKTQLLIEVKRAEEIGREELVERARGFCVMDEDGQLTESDGEQWHPELSCGDTREANLPDIGDDGLPRFEVVAAVIPAVISIFTAVLDIVGEFKLSSEEYYTLLALEFMPEVINAIIRAVANADAAFLDISCGLPGSVHDNRVLCRSRFLEKLDTRDNLPVIEDELDSLDVQVG
ncbi:hypothetical protein R1sor_023548 [Riccia sorocarpa]|uniref:Uncharacterized protein n=1 Tax=Riccia sorocarpa TaxID=122646 RepID=A0ABD3GQ33_9MARC